MYCPKCGKENPDDAQLCLFCGCALTGASVSSKRQDVRISVLGIASLIFGILSVFAFPVIGVATQSRAFGLIGFLVTAMAAIIFGIVGLVQIGTSAGRLTGRGSAVVGITVAGVLLFLIGILSPVLTKVHLSAHRMLCGSNLSGIGKAMLIYANDYDDKLPRAGGKESVWAARINDWKATDKHTAFNLEADGSGGQASISSSLYLLIKYCDMTPKSFICGGGEPDAVVFKLSEETPPKPGFEIIYSWDFGSEPAKHCSYSYHIPYGPFPLTIRTSEPGMAVAADRNPWIPSPFARTQKNFNKFDPHGSTRRAMYGNAVAHRGKGQNVLFLDGHVEFTKTSCCGINGDNIYTYWEGQDIQRGAPPVVGSQPKDKLDSLLVNDPPAAEPETKHP